MGALTSYLDDTDFSIDAAQRKKLREFAWGIARTGLRSRRTAESFPVARKVESLIPGLDEAIPDMIEAFAGPSDRARREALERLRTRSFDVRLCARLFFLSHKVGDVALRSLTRFVSSHG